MTFEPVDFEVRNLLKDLPDRLVGPKVAQHRVLAPGGLWGLTVGEPTGVCRRPACRSAASCPTPRPPPRASEPGDVLTTSTAAGPPRSPTPTPPPRPSPPARTSPVVILRDGKELTLTVQPAEGF